MRSTEKIDAVLALPGLTPKTRTFLMSLRSQAARKPLTARQLAALERIAAAPSGLDYAAINRAALARLPEVLARLLPGGRIVGGEWQVGSLQGEAGASLKVRLYGPRAGMWCDFATGDRGGDVVSLAAAVAGLPQSKAAQKLAEMLRLEGRQHG
ncbi:hypothetical protein [Roseomonas gilardii]|uniref:hypothetical protein n=1 Tax=Roseomonas gilardii TaxID=257708 RepID=UPI0021B5AFAD|nr:hypothetical protein [Roseomonas gilardii]